ncbi:unnamed protein product, partial [Ectocarpus sp. 12 AP-2014]
ITRVRGRLQIPPQRLSVFSLSRATRGRQGAIAGFTAHSTLLRSKHHGRKRERRFAVDLMASNRGVKSFLKAGLPFVTFIVGGSYMLSEFVSGQVHVKDVRKRSKSLREFDIEE